MNLPDPKHKLGYTDTELVQIMTPEEYKDFCKWMGGQTCAMADDGQILTYPYDVRRFLEHKRRGKPDPQTRGETWD